MYPTICTHCASVMEIKTQLSRDIYETADRIRWYNHLRHITTENMTITSRLIVWTFRSLRNLYVQFVQLDALPWATSRNKIKAAAIVIILWQQWMIFLITTTLVTTGPPVGRATDECRVRLLSIFVTVYFFLVLGGDFWGTRYRQGWPLQWRLRPAAWAHQCLLQWGYRWGYFQSTALR